MNRKDKIAWVFIWTVAIAGLLLSLLFFVSVPRAQELTAKQLLAKAATAKVGDVLSKSGNVETFKAANGKLTSRIYASSQWDKDGKALIGYADGTVTARGRYVRFIPDAATGKLVVSRKIGNASVKEFWTVPSAAVTKLVWVVETDAPNVTLDKGALLFLDSRGMEIFRSPAPVAWDADKKPVAIAVSFDGKVLTYTISGEHKYPVTVDPSVVADDTDTATGTTFGSNATYLTIRNATDAPSTGDNTIIVGQRWASPNFTVWRGHLTYAASLPINTAIDSAKVKIVISTDNTTEEFNIHIVEGTFTGNVAVGWFNDFTGWAASGAYSVTNLATAVAAAGSIGDTLTFTLNAAGQATIDGNTTFTLLSSLDIAATQPTDEGHMSFEDDSSYLQIWYRFLEGLTRTTPYDKRPNYIWDNGENVPIWKP